MLQIPDPYPVIREYIFSIIIQTSPE